MYIQEIDLTPTAPATLVVRVVRKEIRNSRLQLTGGQLVLTCVQNLVGCGVKVTRAIRNKGSVSQSYCIRGVVSTGAVDVNYCVDRRSM